MGRVEDAMVLLAQNQEAEKTLVQQNIQRYEQASHDAAQAREALRTAEAQRKMVLAEWVAAHGWSAERVAEYTGLSTSDVADAARSADHDSGDAGGEARPDPTVPDIGETAPLPGDPAPIQPES